MPAGRPRKYNPQQLAEIAKDLEDYIEATEDPILSAFVANYKKYDVLDDYVYEAPEFAVLKKRALKKQEGFLLKKAGSGDYNASLAIFRLKQPQHGYKDKFEQAVDVTSKGEQVATVDPALQASFTEYLKQQTKG